MRRSASLVSGRVMLLLGGTGWKSAEREVDATVDNLVAFVNYLPCGNPWQVADAGAIKPSAFHVHVGRPGLALGPAPGLARRTYSLNRSIVGSAAAFAHARARRRPRRRILADRN